MIKHFYNIDGEKAVQFVAVAYVNSMPDGNGSAGFVITGVASLCDLHKDTPYVVAVHVHETFRRQGIGSGLLEAAIAEAEAAGKPRLKVWCKKDNDIALKIYKRAGFVQTDEPGDKGDIPLTIQLPRRTQPVVPQL